MRTRIRFVLAVVLGAVTLLAASPAQAVPIVPVGAGIDVSWPQCDRDLPESVPFAVVGVNGGTAASTNFCLAEQLSWAARSTTGTAPGQPGLQFYVNTGNPGDVLEEYGVQTWPTDDVDPRGRDTAGGTDEARRNPYGECAPTPGQYRDSTNDLACSWQYGWNRAVETVDDRFGPAARAAGISDAAPDYTWWLDVETMNSWQRGDADALARNTATLEGMTQLFVADGVSSVGLYSTGYQWRKIVGQTLAGTSGRPLVGANLLGRPSWLAGAANDAGARLRCTSATGLTGGPVALVQYIVDDLDRNRACV